MALLAPAAAQFWPFGGCGGSSSSASSSRNSSSSTIRSAAGSIRPAATGSSNGSSQQGRLLVARRRPARRSAESTAAITTPIVVMGDAMADWLAYGLEDAFADRPEFGIVRKHRTVSRPRALRSAPRRRMGRRSRARSIAADKPKFIVMMVGYHDRQAIRERGPATPRRSSGRAAGLRRPRAAGYRIRRKAAPRPAPPQQNEEMRSARKQASEGGADSQRRSSRRQAPTGPMEFQSEAWQAAYVQRIDATIAAMHSANVPVFWVGLPPQRNPAPPQDAVYLNELFRSRAERAGIVYVDIWDGFVDEAGRYVLQGPDVDGQTRRLRSGDTVYFTRAGARKLAHYVEREIQRAMVNRAPPVALPAPEPAVRARPGAARPLAGPVIPLTASIGGGNELLGGGTDAAAPDRSGRDPGAGARRADRGAVRPRRQFCLAAQRRRHHPRGRAGRDTGAAAARRRAEGWRRNTRARRHGRRRAPRRRRRRRSKPAQPQQQIPGAPRPKVQQQPPPGEAKQPPPQRKAPPRANNDNAPRPPLNILRWTCQAIRHRCARSVNRITSAS